MVGGGMFSFKHLYTYPFFSLIFLFSLNAGGIYISRRFGSHLRILIAQIEETFDFAATLYLRSYALWNTSRYMTYVLCSIVFVSWGLSPCTTINILSS